MTQRTTDLVVVGAGPAGLAAATTAREAGADVVVLEARNRVGGRVWTAPGSPPLERGAELLPAGGEAAGLLDQAGASLIPMPMSHGRLVEGRLEPLAFADLLDRAVPALPDPGGTGPDCTLAEAMAGAVARGDVDPSAADALTRYVEQYHAAPADDVSARWVAAVEATGEGAGGGEQVRVLEGLSRLPDHLLERVGAERMRLGHRVGEVTATTDGVHVRAVGPEGDAEWRAAGVVCAVPVAVLPGSAAGATGAAGIAGSPGSLGRPGRLAITPLPDAHASALKGLRMGRVVKLALRFRRRFWNDVWSGPTYLHADGAFRTWWAAPGTPALVAWAGGPAAARLLAAAGGVAAPGDAVAAALVRRAVHQLAGMLGVAPGAVDAELVDGAWHGWSDDPLSGGAYPYAVVGAAGAERALMRPIEGRLVLTGDATAEEMGTVDGALGAGREAARTLLHCLS